MAGIPCGPLVVPNSDHKDGQNKNSKTSDKVNVTCDDGYVNKNNGNLGAMAACVPGDNDKSLWVNLPNCQGQFGRHYFAVLLLICFDCEISFASRI